MATETHLKELLIRWEELRDQGKDVTPEELCRDQPELVEPLRKRIAALRSMDSMLETAQQQVGPGTAEHQSPAESDGDELSSAGQRAPAPAATVPGYEILNELGRGGMGVVYKARQISLNRLVALKMIRGERDTDPIHLDRFRAEAEAIARLQHPNIVTIHEIDTHEGRPYIAFELVEGGSLDDKLGGRPQPPRQAAELIEALAGAIHYAHERGIIHRDLKPGNVLFQVAHASVAAHADDIGGIPRGAMPKITDFGLARRMDSGPSRTRTGTILGTPCYMAPEQAAGKTGQRGRGVDIYALGAILYELLTGRPPLQGLTSIETIHLVRYTEPMWPRRLQPSVPRDLETICMKCLLKDPAKRYATAKELAVDLRRFLMGEPIAARSTPLWERGVKWVRRKPALATLLIGGVLAAAFLVATEIWFRAQLQSALQEARDEHAEAKNRLLRLHVASAANLQDAGNFFTSMIWLVEALKMEPREHDREAHRIRIAATLRSCPTLAQLWYHKQQVNYADFSPDGKRVVTAGADAMARLWDPVSGLPLEPALSHRGAVLFARFSPDGQWVVTTSTDKTARLWVARTRKQHGATLEHEGAVACAAFSPDSRWLATAGAGGMAIVWDVETTRARFAPLKHGDAVRDVDFSDDGRWLLTASAGTVHIWDAATGKPRLADPLRHPRSVCCARFQPSPDKDSTAEPAIATGCEDGGVRLWDAASGKPIWTMHHFGTVNAVVFSPNGQRLATGSADLTARVWDVKTGSQVTPTLNHASSVLGVAFSKDGARLATCGDDNTAQVWNSTSGWPLAPLLSHNSSVRRVAFGPEPSGRWLLTASEDHSARLYELPAADEMVPTIRHEAAVLFVGYGPGPGAALVTASADRTARVWDNQGQPVTPPLVHEKAVRDAGFSPDGQWTVTASDDSTARVWDARTGKAKFVLKHGGPVRRAEFAATGRRIVTASADSTAGVWDAERGSVVASLRHDAAVRDARFSPDGLCVVTASADGTARIWEADSGKRLGRPLRHDLGVTRALFAPDGKRIVTTSEDQTARIWDAESGKHLLSFDHAGIILDAAFDAEGKQLITSSDDNTARVWDAHTGELLVPPLKHKGAVLGIAFSPHKGVGRWIVTASNDNTGRVWDARTGEPLTPPLIHSGFGRITDSAFHPSGQFVATASADATVRIWDLRPTELSLADLELRAAIYSGSRIDEKTLGLVPLGPVALEEKWRSLRVKSK